MPSNCSFISLLLVSSNNMKQNYSHEDDETQEKLSEKDVGVLKERM